MFYVSDADGDWSTPYFDTMLWRIKDAQTSFHTAETNSLVFSWQTRGKPEYRNDHV